MAWRLTAERLFREALEGWRAALGPRHPDTLASANNLGAVYQAQGRYGEAEQTVREALDGARAALGAAHPTTLALQLNRAVNLAAQGRIPDAVRQLQGMQPDLLDRLDVELYTSAAPSVRRLLVASQATYQDVALNLALLSGAGPEAGELAVTAVLRLKGLQGEEEAFLAHLAHHSPDPRVRKLAAEVAALRGRLAAVGMRTRLNVASPAAAGGDQTVAITKQLQEREFALGRVSRDYARQLQIRGFDPTGLRAALQPRTALLELRQYRRLDFRTGTTQPPHWAGLLLHADGKVRVVDLGPAAGTKEAAEALLIDAEGEGRARNCAQPARGSARAAGRRAGRAGAALSRP